MSSLLSEEKELPDTTSTEIESTRPVILWVIPLLLATITPGLQWVVGEGPMAIRLSLACLWYRSSSS